MSRLLKVAPPDQRTVLMLQGTDVDKWEAQIKHRARLFASLQQKEEELRRLRDGPRVTLEGFSLPKDGRLDKLVAHKSI